MPAVLFIDTIYEILSWLGSVQTQNTPCWTSFINRA